MIKYILSCIIIGLNLNPISGLLISSGLNKHIHSNSNTNKILNLNPINGLVISSSLNTNRNTNEVKMLYNYDECPEYLTTFTNLFDKDQSEIIVKGTTSFLTKVDGIGGYILHTNDVIINFLLNNELLNNDIKKSLILELISLSQAGDATGHQILQLYYDLVSCLL